MNKLVLFIVLFVASSIASAFTYVNNSRTGKPDLVTTSVNDLSDYHQITTVFINASSNRVDYTLRGVFGKTVVKTDHSANEVILHSYSSARFGTYTTYRLYNQNESATFQYYSSHRQWVKL